PDTIAICADATLSSNDRETTRLFEKLKDRDRPKAMRLAREFLEDRALCGDDTRCIWRSQLGAMNEFKAALGEGEVDLSHLGDVPDSTDEIPRHPSREDAD